MEKFVLLFCGIAIMASTVHSAAVPAELAEAGEAAHEICVKETGVSEEIIAQAGTGDLPDDEKLKCYLKCIYNQFGLIEKDTINFDLMLTIVPDSIKEAGERAVNNCRSVATGKDMCEKTWNIQKCFFKESPEAYFIM